MDPMIEFLPTLNNGMRLKITRKTSRLYLKIENRYRYILPCAVCQENCS